MTILFICAGDELDVDKSSELDVSQESNSSTSEMEVCEEVVTSAPSSSQEAYSSTSEIEVSEEVDALVRPGSSPSTSTSTSSTSTSTPSTNSCYALSTVVRELTNNMEKLKQCSDEKDAQISVLRERNRKLEDRSKIVEKGILKCFSVNQAKSLISGKPITRWQDEDMANALALKGLGLKCYRYLRNTIKLPLPSTSSINRWVSGINVEPGLLNSVLRMMTQQSPKLTPGQKACTICFDEMKIDSKYCYDRGADRIYNKSSNVQVIMAQGILYNWVQPLYYGYDQRVTKDLLCSIITATEKTGFPVHGVVCDLSGANQGLWRSLGISRSSTSFENPHDPNRKVHVFADPPHLLKLVRNNLIDHGIETAYGTANSDPLYEVIRYQKGDLKMTPRLSELNLCVKGPMRQNVKLAAQLLSESMAKAIQKMAKCGDIKSKNWAVTSYLIDLIDKWFDVLNSSEQFGHKPSINAFTASDFQVETLKSIIHVFESATVKGKVFPFVNGIITSSKSIINLFVDMKEIYSVSFLYTRRLNQDALEHSFGILRQMGRGYEHPDPVSFKYRMRQFILSKKHVLVSINPNTLPFRKDVFVVEGIREFQNCSSPIKKGVGELLELDGERNDENNLDAKVVECMSLDEDFEEFVVPKDEVDGFHYVLGFVAFKFKDQYPYFCSKEKKNTWVALKDRGSLKHMNDDFLESFTKLEEVFRKRHLQTLFGESEAVAKLTMMAGRIKDIPEDVKEYYLRCRIYFRIKTLNKALSLEKTRKSLKKMKKTES